jgi:hypothetical protein
MIESRLGKIENLLIEDQKRKIENLEARMKKTRRLPAYRQAGLAV